MRLLIIGHSVEDHILKDGIEKIQPGGIYYTAAALNAVKADDDELFLCTEVEENNAGLFAPVFDKLNKKYIRIADAIPKVVLITETNKEREEYYSIITGNLDINTGELNTFGGILINMITGFDISVEQLLNLRKSYKGKIYLDVHTLSRGTNYSSKGIRREFRSIPGFDLWASAPDIIQVNREELKTISSAEEEADAAREILCREGQVLIVTKDKSGSSCYTYEGNYYNENAIEIKENNKVGCGDVFGAVFFYTYIKQSDVKFSLKRANYAAGIAASYSGIHDLEKLSQLNITNGL
jgi:hypothetical protein